MLHFEITVMKGGANKKTDAMLILARAVLADRRRRSPVTLLIILAILVVLSLLLGWIFWPKPELSTLLLTAYDQITPPDTAVILRARVEPLSPGRGGANVADCELYFQELSTGRLLEKVATQPDGLATLPNSFSAQQGPIEIMVRYPGKPDRRRGAEGKARVFVWPADAALLIVDADHALADGEAARFWSANNLDIRARPGAAAALRSVRTKYPVIYLSASADRPSRYNKLRAWLERAHPGQDQFPIGPVLSSGSLGPDLDAGEYLTAALAETKKRFHGPLLGITTDHDTALLYQRLGLKTFMVGPLVAAEGVTLAASWKELERYLSE